MEKQFVTHEIALKLKELGFKEPCFLLISCNTLWLCNGEDPIDSHNSNKIIDYTFQKNEDIFHDVISIPLWQQVIDWFREKYDIHISFEPVYKPKQFQNLMYCYAISTKENYYGGMDDNLDNWLKLNDGGNMFHIENSYYTAREQAILKAIELCKKN